MTIDVEELKSKVFYEKYRPTDFKSILLPQKLRTAITKYINSKEIPCLLLHSNSPGVGKTSLSFIICKELNAEYLYINTSLDNGIDVLRSMIQNFATSVSLDPNSESRTRIVIMDEFDGASNNLQDALRASIEEFTESCRFILTCNNLNKISKAIRSRCSKINFDFKEEKTKIEMEKKIFFKLEEVLKLENIQYDKDTLFKLVLKYYPDMRSMYNILQDFADSNNNIITPEILNFKPIGDELITMILAKEFRKSREYVIKSSFNYSDLYRFLYDKLIPRLEKIQMLAVIPIISEFMWRESQGVLDSEINFAHCLINIMQNL